MIPGHQEAEPIIEGLHTIRPDGLLRETRRWRKHFDMCCGRATLPAMSQTATVHARLDAKTKQESEAVLRKIGMTPTDAVRLLYRQIALRGEFPVELRVPNSLTAKTLAKSDRNEEIDVFDSVEELTASWTKE